MRITPAIAMALAAVLLGACGGEKDAAVVAPEDTAGAGSLIENAAEAGAADVSFVLGCKAPFTPDATPATLAAHFGRENVIPETVDGPEGQPLNVTAIYPKDPDRRIEVLFANEEERTGLITVMVTQPTSLWKGPGNIAMGAGIADVETANGGAFSVQGFGWDYGGFVSDWKDGKLGGDGGPLPPHRALPHRRRRPCAGNPGRWRAADVERSRRAQGRSESRAVRDQLAGAALGPQRSCDPASLR